MKLLFTFLFIVLGLLGIAGQEVFSRQEYLDVVKRHHPIVRQANLQIDLAKANDLMSKGGFDPKIEVAHDNKSYDGKNYWRSTSAELKVPTWFGIDLKAGYERNTGEFLGNRELLPPRGLWNAGISLPLGKGLVIDERRAALQQATIFTKASEQERRLILNEVLLDASIAYLMWQEAYQALQIARQGIELAEQRLTIAKSSYINGDKPAIDTLEAVISIQNRSIALNEAQIALTGAKINLENFLWSDGYIPLELADNTIPTRLDVSYLERLIDSLSLRQETIVYDHPEILTTQYKIENLEVENRLNKESLKPDLRIFYNPLLGSTDNETFRPFDVNDYKVGGSLNYPILTRKERGKVRMTNIKIEESTLQLEAKRQQIQTKLDRYRNNVSQLREQLVILNENIENYSTLLAAENRKYRIGESSIFLINSREVKYLESQLKQTLTNVKLLKERLTYLYWTGMINDFL